MQLLILGATGRTGRELYTQALAAGHTVHVIVRDPKKLPVTTAQPVLFTGNPSDPVLLEQAVQGCQVVLSTLNISRTSDFPWAPLRTPKDFLSTMMRNLVTACRQQGVKRVICCSAWGVGNSRQNMPGWFQWSIAHSNLKYPYADHEIQEQVLMNSGLDWTIVRPVVLTNSKTSRPVNVLTDNGIRPKLFISRRAVARFMLECLDGTFINKAVTISNK